MLKASENNNKFLQQEMPSQTQKVTAKDSNKAQKTRTLENEALKTVSKDKKKILNTFIKNQLIKE